MKKIFLLMAALLVVASCIKMPKWEEPETVGEVLERLSLVKTLEIDPPAGKIAIVTSIPYEALVKSAEPETLAIAGVKMIIDVDAAATTNIQYVDENELPDYKNKGIYNNTVMVAFEDSYKGDYDYNDLILYIAMKYEEDRSIVGGGRKVTMKVNPVALGGGVKIGFGYETFDGTDYFITDNCREYFFNGDPTFGINTYSLDNPKFFEVKTFTAESHQSGEWYNNQRINFYITVPDGNGGVRKHYAAGVAHDLDIYKTDNFLNSVKMPYGLVVPDSFNYPQEHQSIYDAYPQFEEWLTSVSLNTFKGNIDLDYTIDREYSRVRSLFSVSW